MSDVLTEPIGINDTDMHKESKFCSHLSDAVSITLGTVPAVVLLHQPQRATLRPHTCILAAQTVVRWRLCATISVTVATKCGHKLFLSFQREINLEYRLKFQLVPHSKHTPSRL
jgi:hypothetical protein